MCLKQKYNKLLTAPDIPLFKKFRDNWSNIDSTNIQIYLDFVKQHYNDCEIDQLVMFYNCELQKTIVRDDYRELIELSIIFWGGDKEKKLKIRPPGAIHQARWMSRAIYSLKTCLLQSHFKISVKEKQALRDVCLFIATVYVKPWLGCTLAVKAPCQDLCFLKTLKGYEKVYKVISQSALSKFCQHLWHLSEEIAALSLFDDAFDEETKVRIVANLEREYLCDLQKKYFPTKEEISRSLYGK